MEQELCRDDVIQLIEMSKQNNNYVCSSDWLLSLANKITKTLNVLDQLHDEIKCDSKKHTAEKMSDRERSTTWTGQLMYKHRGFALPRFEDLGNFQTIDKDDALRQAKERGELWINDTFKDDVIEHWEIKVRPLEVVGLS